MRVEFAAEAEADLEAIAAFIAHDSLVEALGFVTDLRETCTRLASFPRRFPVVRRDKRGEVRKALHGNYLIFFKIDKETVYVIHILHGATNYEDRLLEP